MTSPEVCILKTDGINCDAEMAYAFEAAGGNTETVHINQLRAGERSLNNYGILAVSGGFSYGDDIASGKVLAAELTSYLSDELRQFTDEDKPIIGVCNGFQVLVRTGLLPNGRIGEQAATLTDNESGRFECRWVDLQIGQSACKFVQPQDFIETPIPMQIAHGEGRFFTDSDNLRTLNERNQIVFRYSDALGNPATDFPDNPNGSVDSIAGICDPDGTILGMMPHPERSIAAFHPDRIRTEPARAAATTLFTNILGYTRS